MVNENKKKWVLPYQFQHRKGKTMAQMTVQIGERVKEALKKTSKVSGKTMGSILEESLIDHCGQAYDRAKGYVDSIGKGIAGDASSLETFKKDMEKIMREYEPFKDLYEEMTSDGYDPPEKVTRKKRGK